MPQVSHEIHAWVGMFAHTAEFVHARNVGSAHTMLAWGSVVKHVWVTVLYRFEVIERVNLVRVGEIDATLLKVRQGGHGRVEGSG